MNAKNLLLKFGFVILLVAFLMSIFLRKGLREGIDLRGGYSLVFEVDVREGDSSYMVKRVIAVLKRRIDPRGLENIEWRPLSKNRFEVRMPAGKEGSREARDAYTDALSELETGNIHRSEIWKVFEADEAGRPAAIAALAGGLEDRVKKLQELAEAHDAAMAAKKKITQAPNDADRTKAQEAYQAALNAYEGKEEKLLETNISLRRLQVVLNHYVSPAEAATILDKEIARRRLQFTTGLEDLKTKHAARAGEIDNVVELHKKSAAVHKYLEDPEDLKRLIAKAGVLEFRIAPFSPEVGEGFSLPAADRDRYEEQLLTEGPMVGRGRKDPYQWFKIREDPKDYGRLVIAPDEGGEYYVLLSDRTNDKLTREKDWQLDDAYPTQDSNMTPAVGFNFDVRGATLFATLTSVHKGHAMAILLDDEVYSAPTIQAVISDSGIITGRFSPEDVNDLVRTLDAGSLPARLNSEPVAERTFSPAIGKVNREMGIKAACWGLIAVAAFMLIYYLRAGFIADVALVLNIILVVGAMSAFSAVLTMPGIAGLILTIGIAVDANVLIFERLREEQARAQSVRMALKNAYERAFSAIFDANITTLITCLILGWVSTEEVRGFAITLGLGIVFSMFTALVVTRWIFQLMLDKRMLTKNVFMLHIVGVPRINWMSKRHFFWALSLGMMTMGVISLAVQGKDILGIELSSGTQAVIKLKDGALIDGKLPNDGLVRERFIDRAGQLGYEKLQATARVEELIDKDKVKNFLKDHGLSGDGDITPKKWQGEKLPLVYFNSLDADKDGFLTREELKELPERSYQISTTEDRPKVIREVAGKAFGDAAETRVRRDFKLVKGGRSPEVGVAIAGNGLTKITRELLQTADHKYLPVLGDHLDGVMLLIRDIKPALTEAELNQRIRQMRGQLDFAPQRFNPDDILPLTRADEEEGYSAFAVLVSPGDPSQIGDAASWEGFAKAEQALLAEALHREQAIEVTSFDAQIAGEAQGRAIFAILLSCLAIVAYLWLRFGSAQWGLAAVVCLLHDVLIVVGLVAASAWVQGTFIGRMLGMASFKIDLAMIAAILTVIGYSVNDTIVVFDRIRENRGKLKTVSPQVINSSINQTLGRTLLTSSTTFIVVLIMYIWGGPGIHAFTYALLAGVLFGTYSSVAVASQLLMGFKQALVAKTAGMEATE